MTGRDFGDGEGAGGFGFGVLDGEGDGAVVFLGVCGGMAGRGVYRIEAALGISRVLGLHQSWKVVPLA